MVLCIFFFCTSSDFNAIVTLNAKLYYYSCYKCLIDFVINSGKHFCSFNNRKSFMRIDDKLSGIDSSFWIHIKKNSKKKVDE